ncbi:DeoR/GlpR transcriptional regulator, partial [Mycobacterium tuberculosis]|nr:DeoR/GlpR transcriptional regulator [Mycobacterium tuberculosis]
MHERERHRVITSAVNARPVATVQELVELTGASEATVRRDIAALAEQGRLRKVRGGAEALQAPKVGTLAGRPFRVNEAVHAAEKRA